MGRFLHAVLGTSAGPGRQGIPRLSAGGLFLCTGFSPHGPLCSWVSPDSQCGQAGLGSHPDWTLGGKEAGASAHRETSTHRAASVAGALPEGELLARLQTPPLQPHLPQGAALGEAREGAADAPAPLASPGW